MHLSSLTFLPVLFYVHHFQLQVMLIKNMDETLVNGSIGRVVAFTDSATFLASLKATVKATEEPTVEKAKAGRSLIELPVVRFAVPGGQTREILVQQEDFKVELPNGEVQASRKQLPLVCESPTACL